MHGRRTLAIDLMEWTTEREDHTSSITESRFRAVKFLSTLVRQMGSDVVYLESIPPMLSITKSDAKEDEASSCLVHA